MDIYLEKAINAAIKAGDAILAIYNTDFEVAFKADESPLTAADKAADEVIKSYLKETYPILSEEGRSIPFDERKNWSMFWMVDPLDGTKEFIKKNGEFTVNIALIKNGLPVLGVVYLPVAAKLYFASESLGSFECEVRPEMKVQDLTKSANRLNRQNLPLKYTIVASRSHLSPDTEDFINTCKLKYGDVELISKGSSIKLCLVAEGKAHAYPRLAPTMEWDTAAAHAVAKYAGCKVLDFYSREELLYNKENLLNPHFIVL